MAIVADLFEYKDKFVVSYTWTWGHAQYHFQKSFSSSVVQSIDDLQDKVFGNLDYLITLYLYDEVKH